jgi:hypothetical protein
MPENLSVVSSLAIILQTFRVHFSMHSPNPSLNQPEHMRRIKLRTFLVLGEAPR